MRVLSLVNQKGGCGKTTTAINLAGALAAQGARVLLVDLDPQAHATLGLGCDADDAPSLFELLSGAASQNAVQRSVSGGFALWPSHARLAEFEERATRGLHGERRLRAVLEQTSEPFDFALLDCPPRVEGALAANALFASSIALLVVETGAFALQGAARALTLLEEIAAAQGSRFDVRVVATLFDRRTVLARDLLVASHARFGAAMFDTAIRSSTKLREAAAHGLPIQVYAPRTPAAEDFAALGAEVRSTRLEFGRDLLRTPSAPPTAPTDAIAALESLRARA